MFDNTTPNLGGMAEALLIPLYVSAKESQRHDALLKDEKAVALVHQWYPFCCPEPRLGRARWVRHIPWLAKVTGVYHYRPGQAGG